MRLRCLSVLLVAVLSSAAGCSRAPHPGPVAAAPEQSALTSLLSVRDLAADSSDVWSLVDGAADYTPAPCGTPFPGGEPTAQESATWRHQAEVVQVRLVTYPSARQARQAVRTLARAARGCSSWIEVDASVAVYPLRLDDGQAPPAVTMHLSRFGQDGRSEMGWAVTGTGAQLVSVVTSRPSPTLDTDVDVILERAFTAITGAGAN